MATDSYPKWDYKEYPKTLASDDLWGQVRRTVYGKPIPEDQIQLIVNSIVDGLSLRTATDLLDIGCGNGALGARLFPYCSRYVGIDSSEYLIAVALTRFASPRHTFICRDAVEFVECESDVMQFEKAVCYGVFAYLSDFEAQRLLEALSSRFARLRVLFLGSLPDYERASHFFTDGALAEVDLNNHRSQIGIWRSQARMAALSERTGWRIRFPEVPLAFYQAHYRFNAVLER